MTENTDYLSLSAVMKRERNWLEGGVGELCDG